MNKCRMPGLILSVALLAAGSAFGWDVGHDTVARSVHSRLPEKWKSRIAGQAFVDYLEASKVVDNGDYNLLRPHVDWLKAHGVKAPFQLHSSKNWPLLFRCLVKSVHDDDARAVGAVLAAFSHALSDNAGANHDPLVGILNQYGPSMIGVMPKVHTDLGWVDDEPEAHEAYYRQVAAFPYPTVDDATPEDFCRRLMLTEVEANKVAANASQRITAAIMAQAVVPSRETNIELAEAFAPLGVWATEWTLRCLVAAEKFAATCPNGEMADLDAEAFAKTVDTVTPFLERDWRNDSFARPYLPEEGKTYRIRVLYESTEHMSHAVFSPFMRVLDIPLVRTLRKRFPKEGTAYLDLRDFCREGLDPAVSPLLVVPAGRLESGHGGVTAEAVVRRAADYRAKGGKVLWIGGPLPKAAAPESLVAAYREAPAFGRRKSESWLTRRANLVMPPEFVMSTRMTFWTREGRSEWRFAVEPAFCSGWSLPESRGWFDRRALAPDAAEQIVTLSCDSPAGLTNFLMGVSAPARSPSFVFIPNLAYFPYVFTRETPQFVPFNWTLDSMSDQAVTECVRRLLPEAVKDGVNVNPPSYYKTLFDGTSLGAWTVVSGDWTVVEEKDGRCFGCAGAGKLVTAEDVGDFELQLEFRVNGIPSGMTGLRVRDTTFLLFKDPALNASCGMYDPKRGDSAVLQGGDRPLGEWNRLYVRCFGRKIRALVNDRYAVDFEKMIEATGTGEIKLRGPLAIESAGAPLSFRNVYLRER